jgi:CIC family chloride channel protein
VHLPRSFFPKLHASLDELRRSESQLALVLSLVIGAVVGLVIVAFILLTGELSARMYPADGAGWRRILVPALGSLITGFLLWRFFPLARGSGIPQTKTALFARDGKITLRTVVGKFLCCSASLASGISLGREGPSVQIGAGLASVLARSLGMRKEQVKSLVPIGCSAALAAAFNTPIAAVLFSLEEIMGDLHATVLGTAVLSSATSWMVLHLILGDDPLFHVAGYRLQNPWEFAIYAVLGVVGGLGSVAFVKLLLRLRLWFAGLPRNTVWLQPVAGGLTVGLIGYFVPDIMGVGYNYVGKVLNGDVVLKVVVLLAILKIFATAMCFSSGNAGGIFGPSLFIGAMLGGAVGSVAHSLFPAFTAGPGAYALVGMGAAFAGIIRTPFTSVIMIFEITRDYTIIVPLMISNMVAYFISSRLQPVPIYEAIAKQDGVHWPSSESRSRQLNVASVMRASAKPFFIEQTVGSALVMLQDESRTAWPVADMHGLCGLVRRGELEAAAAQSSSETKLASIVKPLADDDPAAEDLPHVHPDHGFHLALERMGAAQVDAIPVVSRADVRQILGVVVLDDILQAYGVSRTPPTPERSTSSQPE